jgi:FMN reductase
MSEIQIVGVVGNPRSESRTHALARAITRELARVIPGATTAEVDLAALGGRVLDPADSSVSAAVEQVHEADLLVVASPTYQGSYSGLLKAFLDRFEHQSLAGTVAIPVLLGRLPDHRPAVDTHVVPLLLELAADVPARGLFVLEPEVETFDAFAAHWADVYGAVYAAAVATNRFASTTR